MLDEQQFKTRADQALNDLHRGLMHAGDQHGFESDTNSGALTIEFEDGTRFVVSPNSPVRQIWVSALMRSFKLDWEDARGAFVYPETGATLQDLTATVIAQQLGEPIAL
ncbi:MAG TPA: iron donor protein CyaY [Solibacterales bacterium]|nr:iron donor protein CyaY [Bryobacterales bacterium]